MTETSNPFEKLLVGLVEADIVFVTVGGIACGMNGYVRGTEDVDILVKHTDDNIQKLLLFLSRYGSGYGAELSKSDFTNEEGCIRVIEEFPIDIFTVMSGNQFEDFEKHILTTEILGQKIPYLDHAALIQLKKNSLRPKDQIDVLALSQLKKT